MSEYGEKSPRIEEIQQWIDKKREELFEAGETRVLSALIDEINKLPDGEAEEYLELLLPSPTPIENGGDTNED